MVSKGVKKPSAAEVKSSKADDSKRKIFDMDGHLIIQKNNNVAKQAKEFLEKKEQLETEKSTSKKQLTEEEKQQKKRENWRKYYRDNKEKYKKWGENWRKNNPEKVAQYRKNYYQRKKQVKSK